jgi:hypothetical protein
VGGDEELSGNDLSGHVPSAEAERRAHAAGLDLDALRRDDPTGYKMINAAPLLRSAAELRRLAEPAVHAALGDQEIYGAPVGEKVLFLAFPGPNAAQLERLDDLLAQAVEEDTGRYGFYRVVRDRRGVRRELDLPTSPPVWSGEDALVGPFADDARAREWGLDNVMGRGVITFDTVRYAGAWFCDVFSAADDPNGTVGGAG